MQHIFLIKCFRLYFEHLQILRFLEMIIFLFVAIKITRSMRHIFRIKNCRLSFEYLTIFQFIA